MNIFLGRPPNSNSPNSPPPKINDFQAEEFIVQNEITNKIPIPKFDEHAKSKFYQSMKRGSNKSVAVGGSTKKEKITVIAWPDEENQFHHDESVERQQQIKHREGEQPENVR